MTKTFHQVLEEVRRQGEAHAVQSDISVMVRALSIAERRNVEALEAPRLADIVLALAEIKRGLEPIRRKARSTIDPEAAASAKFVLGEVEWLDGEIQKNIAVYVRRSGDAMVYARGNLAWAKQVMKQHRAELAADERRRQARAGAAAKPAAKPPVKRAITAPNYHIPLGVPGGIPVVGGKSAKAAPTPRVKFGGKPERDSVADQLRIDAIVDRLNNAR